MPLDMWSLRNSWLLKVLGEFYLDFCTTSLQIKLLLMSFSELRSRVRERSPKLLLIQLITIQFLFRL